MTETQWLTDDDPERWLYPERVQERSARKLRLFCVACSRRIWTLLPEECQLAVETAEDYADDRATSSVLLRMAEIARRIANNADGNAQDAADAAASTAEPDIQNYAFSVSVCAAKAVWISGPDQTAELAAQANILREIFGNPFRPAPFTPAWRTSDVLLLADGIYAERAFDRLPILADALQDAGCDTAAILDHLRDPNASHVRGCWALDLVLGEE
ncbi:hypothetical protein VT84_36320 [Gemmata sp. SH-PL17]|uniref:hypothetical protein n=1 Tax=Gemmata sp. SH-PL17 TaxID=1630693 RepID=UPI000698D20F|nr:hypothetical protein [Gemmata sp. SH-PL17]AMV29917.1 hypothetical protein VT84_36320 [Gemmata sp. SH-PL17]